MVSFNLLEHCCLIWKKNTAVKVSNICMLTQVLCYCYLVASLSSWPVVVMQMNDVRALFGQWWAAGWNAGAVHVASRLHPLIVHIVFPEFMDCFT
jgi:hypothetical protein